MAKVELLIEATDRTGPEIEKLNRQVKSSLRQMTSEIEREEGRRRELERLSTANLVNEVAVREEAQRGALLRGRESHRAFADDVGEDLRGISHEFDGTFSSGSRAVSLFSDSAFQSLASSFFDPTESRFAGLQGVIQNFGSDLLSIIGDAAAQPSSTLLSLGNLTGPILNVAGLDKVIAGPPGGGGRGSAIGAALGSLLPIPGGGLVGGLIGSTVGGLFKGLSRGAREDDPDISIFKAVEGFSQAFPADPDRSARYLTDILDDFFQLRDYVSPRAYSAILDAAGAVGNIRSVIQGLPGFDIPLSLALERAVEPLSAALRSLRGSSVEGAFERLLGELRQEMGTNLPRFSGGGISPGGKIITEPDEMILSRNQQSRLFSLLAVDAPPASRQSIPINYLVINNEFHSSKMDVGELERFFSGRRFRQMMLSNTPARRDLIDANNVRGLEAAVERILKRLNR